MLGYSFLEQKVFVWLYLVDVHSEMLVAGEYGDLEHAHGDQL